VTLNTAHHSGFNTFIITVARDSDSEDCSILVTLFSFLFSHHRFFDIPGPIFAKLCHTTRCVLKYFIIYGCSYVPPKNLRGKKTPIFGDFRTQNRHIKPAIPNARNIGKSKTIGSVCGYVRTSIPNVVGVPPPTSGIGCPLGVGVGQVNFESI